MRLTVFNNLGADVEVMGEVIPGSGPGFEIPSADLKSWCGDLTFRTYTASNSLGIQDDKGVPISVLSAQNLLDGIANSIISIS